MKIFIDSAKLDEIEEAFNCGFMDGVTTNPSLMKQAVEDLKATDENQKGSQGTEVSGDTSSEGEDIDLAQYIEKILTVARGTPVSLEVTEITAEGMVRQARNIYERFNPVADNVYIKIPVNPVHEGADVGPFAGLQAIKTLAEEGIPVNCTLIFTPEQALLAAKAGAKFVSPFAGRMDDYIRKSNNLEFGKKDYYPAEGKEVDDKLLEDDGVVSGIDLCAQIKEIFDTYDIECEVLAASLRNTRQSREAALAGCDIMTLPLYVIRDLVDHYKTREGMVGFMKDIIPEYEELTK